MGTQAYRANYREAFQYANDQLEEIYSEYHELQLRQDQLEKAVGALEPFLHSDQVHSDHVMLKDRTYAPEPIRVEAAHELGPIPEPVMHNGAPAEPVRLPLTSEPPVAPSYAPVSEANMDPIQARINRALGLAVA